MAQGLMQYAAARQGRRDPRPGEIPSLDIYRRAKSFAQTDPIEAGLIGGSMLPVPLASDVAGFAGDVLGMIKRPEDRTVANAGMAALGLLPFVPALGATIRAYHGSPHNFDKFSMDKIGTGEGAQTYGHGLYFAESPDVAKQYRDELSRKRQGVLVDGEEILPTGDLGKMGGRDRAAVFAHMALSNGVPIEQKARQIRNAARTARILPNEISLFQKEGGWGDADILDEAADHLDAWAAKELEGRVKPKSGSLYEVDIEADPEDFFQYDAPIKDQPKAVRKALREIERLGLPGADIISSMRANPKARGGDVVARAKISGRAFFDELKARGVPGIRYKDAMSRGKGDGTYNYVVFDENLLEIKNKK